MPRKARKLETKAASKYAALVAVARGKADLAPRRSWHPYADLDSSDKPKHGILVVKPGSRYALEHSYLASGVSEGEGF